jgi:hypothetical protein
VTASTMVHAIKKSATARISMVLALISRNFLCVIRQKTGGARFLFHVPAFGVSGCGTAVRPCGDLPGAMASTRYLW